MPTGKQHSDQRERKDRAFRPGRSSLDSEPVGQQGREYSTGNGRAGHSDE